MNGNDLKLIASCLRNGANRMDASFVGDRGQPLTYVDGLEIAEAMRLAKHIRKIAEIFEDESESIA